MAEQKMRLISRLAECTRVLKNMAEIQFLADVWLNGWIYKTIRDYIILHYEIFNVA